jgi:hypothetical protein
MASWNEFVWQSQGHAKLRKIATLLRHNPPECSTPDHPLSSFVDIDGYFVVHI